MPTQMCFASRVLPAPVFSKLLVFGDTEKLITEMRICRTKFGIVTQVRAEPHRTRNKDPEIKK